MPLHEVTDDVKLNRNEFRHYGSDLIIKAFIKHLVTVKLFTELDAVVRQ